MKKGKVIVLALVASMAMMACSNQKSTTESSVEASSDAQASTEEETKVSLLQYSDNISEDEWKAQIDAYQNNIWIFNKEITLPSDISVFDNLLVPAEFKYDYEDQDGTRKQDSVKFKVTDDSKVIKEAIAGIKTDAKKWYSGYLSYRLIGQNERQTAEVEVDFDINTVTEESLQIQALRVSSLSGLSSEDFMMVGRLTLGDTVSTPIKGHDFYTRTDSDGKLVIYQWGYQVRYPD